MDDRRVWASFLLLALAWGTSFLFIKVALRTIEPLLLVSVRLLIGLLGLLLVARLRSLVLPRNRSFWAHMLVLGAINTAIPFVLITASESGPNGIDSAVASVLNSAVPLFSIVIAGAILHLDLITPGRVAGLMIGFGGVVLLLSRDLSGAGSGIGPELLVVAAALCYAIGSAYARLKVRGYDPVLLAVGQVLVADVLVWLPALTYEGLAGQRLTWPTVGALLWLGLVGSCLAYILYFYVLRAWGPTRTTSVTYLLPIVGVSAGALFLGERVDWRLLVGGALILLGVAAVNWRPRTRRGSQVAGL